MNKLKLQSLSVSQLNDCHYELLLEADPSIELLQAYLPDSTIFALSKEKQVIGMLVLCPCKEKSEIEIKTISVSKAYRRQGFGFYLLEEAESFAKKHQFTYLVIGTGSTSFHQLYMYQKFGFRMDYIVKDFFLKYKEELIENQLKLYDMVILRKKL
ncbi:GNAT family N-acetyltransferase [Vagococcus xieshaowenii]|uniref:GNAT family N-acetyltransferase n=1 Tax=Vagococcus xieshaowenii TaxID=2562451 RepID=A0A4Z0DBF4_9ENTE|nr:GNAT family N-acetyltransferase [Vagococcus xieshaowenii]QCA28361.1 GNAT family N-acetyltransferase [Vagococcus xieshaowenii]TFZ42251.1 GNAT family N-acetyltransferase [Vagococcus xieshaowenii]